MLSSDTYAARCRLGHFLRSKQIMASTSGLQIERSLLEQAVTPSGAAGGMCGRKESKPGGEVALEVAPHLVLQLALQLRPLLVHTHVVACAKTNTTVLAA